MICLGGWFYVVTLPDEYQATAGMYVDTESQLRQILGNQIVEGDVEARVNFVRQELLGTLQLQEVARKTGLAHPSATPDQMEAVVARLRGGIQLSVSGNSRRNQQSNEYTIRYRDTNRQRALAVVDTLVQEFVQGAQSDRLEDSEHTRIVLEQERDQQSALLTEANRKLADFRRENADVLPGAEGKYFERLQAQRADLQDLRDELEATRSRRNQLRIELDAALSSTATDPVLEERIRGFESQRADLMLNATDRHPLVSRIDDVLADLYRQRDELAAAPRDRTSAELSTDPVVAELSLLLATAETDIAALTVSVEQGELRVAELQALIDEIPAAEFELEELTKDSEFRYNAYQQSLRNLEIERLSRQTAENERMEFEIYEPPTAPTAPVAPRRPALLAAVLLAGFAGGGAIAFFLAQLRPVFPNQKVLNEVVGLPVLGTVSRTWTERHKVQRRAANVAFAFAAMALIAVYGGVFLFETVGPGFRSILA